MKKGDQRRQAIIEAAETLFYRNGYEGTSVQDVLDVLNLSKGGFYHHFDSKLRLLEAICADKIDMACAYAQEAVASCGDDPLERLNVLLSHMGLLNQKNADFIGLIIRVAYAGEGALLRDSLKRGYIEKLLPLMDGIILDGFAAGAFHAPHPDRLGEMVLNLGSCLTDEIGFTLAAEKENAECAIGILEKLNAYRHAVEAILGAPYGSVELYEMSWLIQLIRELNEQDRRLNSTERILQ